MAQQAAMQAAVGNQMLEAAKLVEEQLDAEIQRLETMDDDDYERIKQRRVQEMKRSAKQREVCSNYILPLSPYFHQLFST